MIRPEAVLVVLAITVSNFCSVSALAAEDASTPAKQSESGQLKAAFPPGKTKLSMEELLIDLRDTRLSLLQIKQQAVNLFMEATRTAAITLETPKEHTPQELSAEMLDSKAAYLAPRKEWLVFYLNTLEPVIHLLTVDLKEVEENGLNVSADIESKLTPLWKPWQEDVDAINKLVDELQSLIAPESGTNLALAKAALSIYQRANNMESIRFQAAKLCRDELKNFN